MVRAIGSSKYNEGRRDAFLEAKAYRTRLSSGLRPPRGRATEGHYADMPAGAVADFKRPMLKAALVSNVVRQHVPRDGLSVLSRRSKDAEGLIAAWNERQARWMPILFSPTIGAAIAARHWFLWVRCPAHCLATPARPDAPFAELVQLSRTSIVDEMRIEHTRRIFGV